MTWRERLTIRILLMVARIVAEDDHAVEVKHLDNHMRMMRAGEDE